MIEGSDIRLLARRALAYAESRLPSPARTSSTRRFEASVRILLPGLSDAAAGRLYQCHRRSMQQSRLLRTHLAQLPRPALAQFLDRQVDVEGAEVLDLVKSDDRPVVFVTPHYGHYTVSCLKLIQSIGMHKTVNAFYDPPQETRGSERFEDLFSRLGFGFNALFNDNAAVLRALRVLKRREALTMMPDIFDLSGRVIYVPFFGRLMPAMAGTALFALKSEARVVIGYNIPSRGWRSTLRVLEPIEYAATGCLDSDISNLTALIFRRIEDQIRVLPEHWDYLGRIGHFLSGQLELGGRDQPEAWLATLRGVAPRVDALWPALARALQDVASFQEQATRAFAVAPAATGSRPGAGSGA